MQTFDPGHVVHQAEGVAVHIEPAAIEARPCSHTRADEPSLKATCSSHSPAALSFGLNCLSWDGLAGAIQPMTAVLFSCTRFHNGTSIGMPRA